MRKLVWGICSVRAIATTIPPMGNFAGGPGRNLIPRIQELEDPGRKPRPYLKNFAAIINDEVAFKNTRYRFPVADIANLYPGVRFTIRFDADEGIDYVDFETPVQVFESEGVPLLIQPRYSYAVVINDRGMGTPAPTECLAQMVGEDMTAARDDAGIDDILEEEFAYTDWPTEDTPRQKAWDATKTDRVMTRFTARGVPSNALNIDTPMWAMINGLAQRIKPGVRFDARKRKCGT